MKTSSILLSTLCGLTLWACNNDKVVDNYTVSVAVPQSVARGTVAYMVDFDTDQTLDSTIVETDTIRFTGHCDNPAIVRVVFPSTRRMFVLEPGEITVSTDGTATGSALNDSMEAFGTKLNQIESVENDSTLAAVTALCDSVIATDSPVGYYALLQLGYYLELPQLDSLLTQHPYYADFNRVSRLRKAKQQAAKTAPGQPYIDFEVNDSTGNKVHLSDYVKPGQYTVVDFWASWCRYCIMEIPSLKKMAERYGDKGLNIVGVAVWDKPEASQQSIEKHGVDWPQILDAQSIPTDLYGVTGIPQIFIIGPDGKIVARDLQGERLTSTVDSLMKDFKLEQ